MFAESTGRNATYTSNDYVVKIVEVLGQRLKESLEEILLSTLQWLMSAQTSHQRYLQMNLTLLLLLGTEGLED